MAGTHGKTTTTALVAWLLDRGGLDPLVLIGADTPAFPQGARLGRRAGGRRGRRVRPPLSATTGQTVAVVTSVEADHLDYYARPGRDSRRVSGAGRATARRTGGWSRAPTNRARRRCESPARRETYGFAADADWQIDDYVALAGRGARFTLRSAGRAWPVAVAAGRRAQRVQRRGGDRGGRLFRRRPAGFAGGAARRSRARGGASRPGAGRAGSGSSTTTAIIRPKSRRCCGPRRRRPRATCGWCFSRTRPTARRRCSTSSCASFGDAQHALILPIYRPSGREIAAARRCRRPTSSTASASGPP